MGTFLSFCCLGVGSFQQGLHLVSTVGGWWSGQIFLLLWVEKTKKENKEIIETMLVGGFNPSEKYESNGIISPNRDENKKYLKPPPSYK